MALTKTVSRKVDQEAMQAQVWFSRANPDYAGKKYLGKEEVKNVPELSSESFEENHFTPTMKE